EVLEEDEEGVVVDDFEDVVEVEEGVMVDDFEDEDAVEEVVEEVLDVVVEEEVFEEDEEEVVVVDDLEDVVEVEEVVDVVVEKEALEEDEEVLVDDFEDVDDVMEEEALDEELVEDPEVVPELEVDIGEVVFVVDEIVDIVGVRLELVLVLVREDVVIEEDVEATEEATVVEDVLRIDETDPVFVDDCTEVARLGEAVLLDVDVLIAFWYMLRRDGPPQYSVALALHNMLHCVSTTEAPGTFAEPALIVFPH
ncbi:MAG: hypothetical protein Q9213_008038, partial [Squamulea squamosa]